MITKDHLSRCMNYEEYKQLLQKLISERKTTGFDQSQERLDGTHVNFQRMMRVERQVTVSEELKATLDNISGKYRWIVLTEGWCADTAQQMPVFNAVAEHGEKISLCLLLRDDNPAVMEQYLTNGTRSIPKLICVNADTLEEKFTWGPRPSELQRQVKALIAEGGSKEQKGLLLQRWYNSDRTVSLQKELASLVKQHLT